MDGGGASQAAPWTGTVVDVGVAPATYDGMMAVLADDAQVRRLLASGPLVPVTINLPATSATTVMSGTPCQVRLMVGQSRPIDLVLPSGGRP